MSAQNPVPRLLSALGLFLGVYGVSLFILPSVKPLADAVRHLPGAGPSALSQLSFLASSVLLVLTVGKGRFREFGFRWAPWPLMGQALKLGFAFSLPWMGAFLLLLTVWVGPSPATDATFNTGLGEMLLSIPLLATVCEEIFYRGFLQNYLRPLSGYRLHGCLSAPVLLGALAFGLGHLCLLGMMPPPVVAFVIATALLNGLLAGVMLERSGSLLPPILVHWAFNASGAFLPWLAGRFLMH